MALQRQLDHANRERDQARKELEYSRCLDAILDVIEVFLVKRESMQSALLLPRTCAQDCLLM
jgi:hypothetical protein